MQSANLACSGARTYTQPFSSGSDFKPGLDFYDDGAGHIGQAKALEQYAASHDVKMVVALIGANDYGFAAIVQQCVQDWLLSPWWWPDYCYDDSSITWRFTPSNVASITARVANAFLNLRTAMRNAGYGDSQWTLLAQNGRNALVGHRLCENTDGLLEEEGLSSWRSPGAADKSEWVSQIRTATTLFGPYQLQEDLHPSYWGELALRNCLRQAYGGGAVRGGACTRTSSGLDSQGEPNMSYG